MFYRPLTADARRSPRTAAPWLAALGLSLVGCQGEFSEEAPVHLNPNMDDQAYVQAQEGHPFFEDGRGMRPQVPGTIAQGELGASKHRTEGRIGTTFAEELPTPLNRSMLERGANRYKIYCTPCHGYTGEAADATVTRRGIRVRPSSYLDPRLLAMPVGQIYEIVSNGVRNMPGYGDRLPISDRWAIVAYVRALQLAGTAPLEWVPEAVRQQKGWEAAQ